MSEDRTSVWRDSGKRCDTCHWYAPVSRRCERLPELQPTTPARVCLNWLAKYVAVEQILRDATQGRV